MFFFQKRTRLAESGILQGFTDWHCHLLPGMDDGVKSMEEALEILSGMECQGIRELWLTPHVMEDMPNTTKGLRARFAELQVAYPGAVRLHLAAEYMMDNLFEERLAKNDLLPLGERGDCLLVETSYFNPLMGLKNVLLRIRNKGYYPVLAHPERYAYMCMTDYEELREKGVLFQMNLSSFVGMYGGEVKTKADALLKRGMYNLVGSDIHSAVYYRNLLQAKVKAEQIRAVCGIRSANGTV